MKNPKLKFKYATGVGDLVACILHSKIIGWLTKLITGKKEPCQVCSQRAYALNVLFPIPFWRLFFKNYEIFNNSLNAELLNYGYSISKPIEEKQNDDKVIKPIIKNKIKDYEIVSTTDNELGEYLIRHQIYKINK